MALISFPIGTGYDHFPILFFFHWWWYLFLPALSFNPTFTRRVTLKGEGVYESLEWKWGHYAFVILLINWLLRRFIIQSLVVFSWCEMIERATHFFLKTTFNKHFHKQNRSQLDWCCCEMVRFRLGLANFPFTADLCVYSNPFFVSVHFLSSPRSPWTVSLLIQFSLFMLNWSTMSRLLSTWRLQSSTARSKQKKARSIHH